MAANDFDKIWEAYNVDGDGFVDVEEAYDTLHRVNATVKKETIAQLVAMITGGRQKMSKEDLKCMMDVCEKIPDIDNFVSLDKDKSGKIDKNEVQQLLGCTEDEAKQFIAELDSSGDGQIDIKELVKCFGSK